ncbi:hypothetical protein SLNSH_23465 [Alsobacter soli]|uniref:DUF2933 domain-containing protein n=1 Tax=Alsobacter soli TaxID=2109933 RepID=A0A2T1HLP9_9HYPH|nr:DUF2933 domain-containing protein [Alsobacter soli]PSC02558.1 hypothetical protein SLNSH_23465 [Alsobacter soli]
MTPHDLSEPRHEGTNSFWRSAAGLGLAVLLAVAAFYLLAEHQAHLFGVLPYLFLLACPLMHMFMHGGHHHHHGSPGGAGARPDEPGR